MHPVDKFYWTYEDLFKLTPVKKNAVYQAATRGRLNLNDLESVVVWLARHGHNELKQRIVAYALAPHDLPDPPRKLKRARPQRVRKPSE